MRDYFCQVGIFITPVLHLQKPSWMCFPGPCSWCDREPALLTSLYQMLRNEESEINKINTENH